MLAIHFYKMAILIETTSCLFPHEFEAFFKLRSQASYLGLWSQCCLEAPIFLESSIPSGS